MFISLASLIRNISKRASLKDDFTLLMSIKDEIPETFRPFIERLTREQPKDLESIHDEVRGKLKEIKDLTWRSTLQILILKPIQEALGRISPMDLNRSLRRSIIKLLQSKIGDEIHKKEKLEKLVQEGLTTGARPSQIKQKGQQIYASLNPLLQAP